MLEEIFDIEGDGSFVSLDSKKKVKVNKVKSFEIKYKVDLKLYDEEELEKKMKNDLIEKINGSKVDAYEVIEKSLKNSVIYQINLYNYSK